MGALMRGKPDKRKGRVLPAEISGRSGDMRRSCAKQIDRENRRGLLTDQGNRSNTLDAFKLFFAVCVVAIHTYALDGLPQTVAFWLTQGVFRLAVPFFFVVSGFLLGRKLYGQGQGVSATLRRYTVRLLWPLLFVGGANAVLELISQRLQYGRSLRYLAWLFFRHILFYPYGAMWFVQACIVGAWLLYPFLKRKKTDAALLVGALLYGWALLCNNYYFVAQAVGWNGAVDLYMNLFITARNGVFVGFFFLALGIKVWELYSADIGADRSWQHRGRKCRCIALAGIILLYGVEIYWTRNCAYLDDRALYLTHILLIPMLLLCIVDIKLPISDSAAIRMQRASEWMYFSHRFLYGLGGLLCILKFGTEWRGPCAFAEVLAVSAVSFVLVVYLRRAFV